MLYQTVRASSFEQHKVNEPVNLHLREQQMQGFAVLHQVNFCPQNCCRYLVEFKKRLLKQVFLAARIVGHPAQFQLVGEVLVKN